MRNGWQKIMIRFGTLDFGINERNAIQNLIDSNNPQLSMGKKVHEFEQRFAKWIGSKYAVMVNSGTSALMTSLSALRIYMKDGVGPMHTTALTYPAVWNAIEATNYDLYVLDVNDNFVLYPKRNEDWFEDFLSVHLLGKPCSVPALIEDASEALGSSFGGKMLGTNSYMGCFSFYVAHQITTVEGGMVVTDHKELYDLCRSIRDNGRICTCPICTLKTLGKCQKREDFEGIERRWKTQNLGYNFKPTEFQGALGCVKMDKIDANIVRRHEIFLRYAEEFNTLKEEKGEYIVPIAYPIKVKNPQKSVAKLLEQGIECRGMFPAYSPYHENAYRISQTHILIPLHHNLSDENVEYIIERVKERQI